ncbi:MAG TPA: SWIM zinc finger family protein [Bacilli bacterium]
MPAIPLKSHALDYLKEELKNRFAPEMIDRGFDYYLKKKVRAVEFIPNGKIISQVNGTRRQPYKVELDTDFFAISFCTCPYEGFCKHMVAVIFQTIAMAGQRPELLYREIAGEAETEQFKRQQAEQRKKRQTVSTARNLAKEPVVSETDTPQKWLSYIRERLNRYNLTGDHGFVKLYHDLEKKDAVFPHIRFRNGTLELLFFLFAYVEIIGRFDAYSRKYGNSYAYSFYTPFAIRVYQHCMDELDGLLEDFDHSAAQNVAADYLKALIPHLSQQLADCDGVFADWLYIYRVIWTHMLNVKDWVAAERANLQQLLDHNKLSPQSRESISCGLIHLDVLERKDRAAMEKIDRLTVCKQPKYWFQYLYQFYTEQQWDRLLAWLQWMAPLIKKGGSEFNNYLEYWDALAARHPVEREWSETMRYLLPHSYAIYAKRLLETKRYAEWADVTMDCGKSASPLQANVVREVEKAAPEVLLPIYHQYVELCILQKNREYYRIAVKALRRLGQCYKKLKRADDFQRFLEALCGKYYRLRALQEELRKGKLIS